jgi:putative hydrolase of the HAD superfamily
MVLPVTHDHSVATGGIDVVAFDGDDTLWHNESVFSMTHERFAELMAPYVQPESIGERLLATEMRNLSLFGYGVKSFTLSMIETAIELSRGKVSASEVQAIIDAGRSMLGHPVELLDGAEAAIRSVSEHHRVMLITKGDLFDQESKLARSGLGDHFDAVEIVATKDERAYRKIMNRHGTDPARFVMIGNSPRSDIVPVLGLGGWAIHVPHPLTWALERIDDEAAMAAHEHFRLAASLDEVPAVIAELRA